MEENIYPIRINKYLSEIGFCSRREADNLIANGRIIINNIQAELGQKINFNDKIFIDGEIINHNKNKKLIYIAFNKPAGIVCTTDTKIEKDNIIDYINFPSRIFPIGRLDKLSQGLIFLTNDGDIVNKILRAKNYNEKEYIVDVNKPISKDFISKMSKGIPILNTITRPCSVTQLNKKKI